MALKFKLRPELKDIRYWIHLPIIAFVVLFLLDLFNPIHCCGIPKMLTIENILFSSLLLAVGDIIAHSILGLD